MTRLTCASRICFVCFARGFSLEAAAMLRMQHCVTKVTAVKARFCRAVRGSFFGNPHRPIISPLDMVQDSRLKPLVKPIVCIFGYVRIELYKYLQVQHNRAQGRVA